MREYVKIYCCGDCIYYNWKKHKCNRDAHEEGKADEHFFRDCPIGFVRKTMKTKTIELTEGEAYALAEIISMNLFDIIRNNTDIDSMEWLNNVLSAYKKMCECSGYVGLTDRSTDEE